MGKMASWLPGFLASQMNSKLKIRGSQSRHAGTEREIPLGMGVGDQLSRKRQQYCVVTGRFHRLYDQRRGCW